jgi:uncharacterized protein
MVDIDEMGPEEMHLLLQASSFGHLGCSRDGSPYVVPIHYVFVDGNIYLYTTEGMKTEYIASNPEVCLQVEDIKDSSHWKSVIAVGKAERLMAEADKKHALALITTKNPRLTPAISRTWVDAWGRANVEAIYRIRPSMMSGRKTISPKKSGARI